MSLKNTGFHILDNLNKEFRAVPPEKPFKLIAEQNKMVVYDTKNPQNIVNGEYIAKSSSETIRKNTNNAIRAFDNNKNSFWHTAYCCGNGYMKGPYKMGKYIGGGKPDQYFTTTTLIGEKIAGEWIEINLPYKLQMTRYSILTSRHCCPKRFPTQFTILGSNDGSVWNVLDKRNIPGNPQSTHNVLKPVMFKLTKETAHFNRFRIVFERSMHDKNNNVMNIGEIEIYGLSPKINIAGQTENFQTYSNKTEGMSLMSNEAQLLADLNDFNAKYARYVTCTGPLVNGTNNKLGCKPDEMDINTVNSAYNKITTSNINALSGGSLYTVYNTPFNTYTTNSVADVSFNDITKKHKDIVQLRSELDAKLKEVYATEDSLAYEQKRLFDGTVYTSLVWTVLATTTLFYVFKNL